MGSPLTVLKSATSLFTITGALSSTSQVTLAAETNVVDATKANKNTVMPLFGRHSILSDNDIDNAVEFIYSL